MSNGELFVSTLNFFRRNEQMLTDWFGLVVRRLLVRNLRDVACDTIRMIFIQLKSETY